MHASDSRWPLDLIGRADFKGQENAGVGREFKFKFPSKNIVNMQLGGPTESHTSNQSKVLQSQSLTVTPLTVTVGYRDTFSDSQTINNGFQAVTVTNMQLQ